MVTAKELRAKTDAELAADEAQLRKQLFDVRYKHATRQLEDTASIKKGKKDLARLLTVKTERAQKPIETTEKK
jgi:large subunit ribosomal protein L29